jgi:hypothetical protein
MMRNFMQQRPQEQLLDIQQLEVIIKVLMMKLNAWQKMLLIKLTLQKELDQEKLFKMLFQQLLVSHLNQVKLKN